MQKHHEAEIFIPVYINLECTHRSVAAKMYGWNAGPAEGPEFEIAEILVGDDREVKSWSDLIEFVGLDGAERMLAQAEKEAAETGEF